MTWPTPGGGTGVAILVGHLIRSLNEDTGSAGRSHGSPGCSSAFVCAHWTGRTDGAQKRAPRMGSEVEDGAVVGVLAVADGDGAVGRASDLDTGSVGLATAGLAPAFVLR